MNNRREPGQRPRQCLNYILICLMPYLITKNPVTKINAKIIIPIILLDKGKPIFAINDVPLLREVISIGIFTPLTALNDELATGVATTEILVFDTPSSRTVTCTITSFVSSDSSIKLEG